MTALSAARERLDNYVASVANRQIILEPDRLKRLTDEVVLAVRAHPEEEAF